MSAHRVFAPMAAKDVPNLTLGIGTWCKNMHKTKQYAQDVADGKVLIVLSIEKNHQAAAEAYELFEKFLRQDSSR